MTAPSSGRIKPAIRRSSELLPAPLAPVSTIDLLDSTLKLTPEKTRRPPRTQLRSVPLSSITADPGMIHACCDHESCCAHEYRVHACCAAIQAGIDAGFRRMSQRLLVQNFRSCGRTREKSL